MRISGLVIRDFQQFKDFDLDLTNPNTGTPLDKVCFIGRNGTGKSTLLRLITHVLRSAPHNQPRGWKSRPAVALQTIDGGRSTWLCNTSSGIRIHSDSDVLIQDWRAILDTSHRTPTIGGGFGGKSNQSADQEVSRASNFTFDSAAGDLLVYVPPENASMELHPFPTLDKLPRTTLNQALNLFKSFPFFHEVAPDTVSQFWDLLIYLIKKREQDWLLFPTDENRKKPYELLEQEFNNSHPEILRRIGELWNELLAPAGLQFDWKSAKVPVQLNENLEAYVKVVASGKSLGYDDLSTGIRNYLFRLGHICALYFGRKIRRGFLLLDEPENSLYPDFLFDLIGIYLSVIENTQFFTATHSPIIAAQFRPEERVILDFDDDHFVTARRGVTPVGDDPNDILEQDFQVRSLYGEEGIAKWERFLELRRLIPKTADQTLKENLMHEYLQIGNAYNFMPDALPQ